MSNRPAMTSGESRSARAAPAVPTQRSLFLAADARITCPECDSKFSLQRGLSHGALEQLEESTADALEELRRTERSEALKAAQQLAAQRDGALRDENTELKKLLQERGEKHAQALREASEFARQDLAQQLEQLQGRLSASQEQLGQVARREEELRRREQQLNTRIAEAARVEAAALIAAERESFASQLADRERVVGELRARELSLLREQQSLKDRAGGLENEVARKVDAARAELEGRIRSQERERADLEKAELQKRLADVNQQLAEAQRKGTQGSQQLQGEVLELSLQAHLEAAFPLDVIEEVRKGARGGDIVQRVMTRSAQPAGVVLWETKRAKDWSPQWATKLKEDLRACGADLGILVSIGTALPREWQEGQLFGLHEDVWVSSWTTALQLATVLRSGLLDLHKQRLVSAGKGEKMEAVYDYLTSSQFAHKLKAVYGAFHRMRQELEAEKSQTLQRWARREKQLQSGVAELVGVAGDIQGLAQQDLPLLEIESGAGVPAEECQTLDSTQLGLRIER
jgi:hypothetical protein